MKKWLRIIIATLIWTAIWFVNQFVPNQAKLLNIDSTIAYITQQAVVALIASITVLVVGRSPVLNIILTMALVIVPMVYMGDVLLSGEEILIWYYFFIPVIAINIIIILIYTLFFHKSKLRYKKS